MLDDTHASHRSAQEPTSPRRKPARRPSRRHLPAPGSSPPSRRPQLAAYFTTQTSEPGLDVESDNAVTASPGPSTTAEATTFTPVPAKSPHCLHVTNPGAAQWKPTASPKPSGYATPSTMQYLSNSVHRLKTPTLHSLVDEIHTNGRRLPDHPSRSTHVRHDRTRQLDGYGRRTHPRTQSANTTRATGEGSPHSHFAANGWTVCFLTWPQDS